MYSQLLYFIVALLLFSIQQPGTKPLLPAFDTFALAAGFFAFYVYICAYFFRGLRRGVLMEWPQSVLTLRYHRLQTSLSILALIMLVIYTYVLDIKFYMQRIPGFEQSLTLSGASGLVLLLLHQTVVWFMAHPIYKRIYRSNITRVAFIKGNLSFNSAILVPWLITSLVFDAIQVMNLPDFLKSDTGQYLMVGCVFVLFILLAPPIVVRLWGCQVLPQSATKAELENFCARQRFRIGNFMLWPLFGGEILTAGVMGVLPRLRYILITRGLLALLDTEELEAVVGHEMGHVRLFHVPFYLLFFIAYSWLTYSLSSVVFPFLLKLKPFVTFVSWALTPGNMHLTLFSIVYVIPMLIMLVVYFRYIFGFFLRNSERQADIYSLKLIGHPFTLISSLHKIALYSGQIEDLPSWHHYSIRQRINFLLDAYENPNVIRRHNRKLYGAAAVFLVLVLCLGSVGLHLKDTKLVKGWDMEIAAGMLERGILQNPENAMNYARYGGILLEMGRYAKAESALRKANELSPNDPVILNNLAWLYATAPPPQFNPGAALKLALEATDIDSNPQYLDTLAEAYFVNGRFKEAVDTIQKALLGEPDNRAYYLKQKEKFEQALRNHKTNGRSVLLPLESVGHRASGPAGIDLTDQTAGRGYVPAGSVV